MGYFRETKYLVWLAWNNFQEFIDTEEHIHFSRKELWAFARMHCGQNVTIDQVIEELKDDDVKLIFNIFIHEIKRAYSNYKGEMENEEI